ncbi:hypothetical protein [Qipengyuania sp. YIM B01966]|uniref:hypothetical protein n=1 Tax=Qipengyuania sp. YIM B01966 TaxID=2778646 RepID=UPI001F3E8CF5|nr:hypothetical protein [Qipengyuania sp. YIM B01966]
MAGRGKAFSCLAALAFKAGVRVDRAAQGLTQIGGGHAGITINAGPRRTRLPGPLLDASPSSPDEQDILALVDKARELAALLRGGEGGLVQTLVGDIVGRIDIMPSEVRIKLDPAGLSRHLRMAIDAESLALLIIASATPKRSGLAMRMVLDTGEAATSCEPDARLIDAIAKAHAHVTGVGFHAAANKLRDTLVAMDFDERTARDEIIAQQQADAAAAVLPLPERPAIPPVVLQVRPDLSAVPLEVRDAITLIGEGDGVSVVIDPNASDTVLEQLGEVLAPLAGDEDPRPAIAAHVERRQAAATPSQRGMSFTVPGLALEQYGELDLVEPTTLLDLAGWTLDGVDPDLPEFLLSETPDTVVVDVDEGQVRISRSASQMTLQLEDETAWTPADLSRWLDRQVHQPDVSQPVFLEYCRRVVTHLVDARGMSLASLVRAKDMLKRAIALRVKQLRAEAGQAGMQLLLGDIRPTLALGENGFTFAEGRYLPPKPYTGRYAWQKHFYPRPDDIKDSGEEYQCAVAIDSHPLVRHWVRNIVRGAHSYWLPTSTDRFYPDFVAELTDGRTLVLEYKGAHLVNDPDTLEKANIGARLAEVSGGQVVFWMAERSKATDFTTRLDAALRGNA